jgi:predicted small metal-binding protein
MDIDQEPSPGGTIPGYSGNPKETTMAKVLRCRDLGMKCAYEIRADTEEELLRLAAEHAEKDHGIHVTSIPPSIMAMVKAAIRDE